MSVWTTDNKSSTSVRFSSQRYYPVGVLLPISSASRSYCFLLGWSLPVLGQFTSEITHGVSVWKTRRLYLGILTLTSPRIIFKHSLFTRTQLLEILILFSAIQGPPQALPTAVKCIDLVQTCRDFTVFFDGRSPELI